MTAYHIKRLPPEILPDGASTTWSVTGGGTVSRLSGGVAVWPAADAERWRRAGVPAVLAPFAGGWILAALVVAAYVLLFGLSSASAARGGGGGTDWLRYPGVVLLTALPFWYRYIPVAAVPAALYVAVAAGLSLARPGDSDRPAAAGHLLVLAVCAMALTGSCLRLRARGRQRALALEAAGKRRFPLPDRVPESDGHRGHAQVYLGLALCLVAVGILTDGLVEDLTSGGVGYDAVGHQRIALVLLVAGTTFGGWGQVAYRAARRLHEKEQPALLVGVRAGADGRHWICADARTRTAPPLIAYTPRASDTRDRTRLLGSGSAYGVAERTPRHRPEARALRGGPVRHPRGGRRGRPRLRLRRIPPPPGDGADVRDRDHGPAPPRPPPPTGPVGTGGRRRPAAGAAACGPGAGGAPTEGTARGGGAPQEPTAPPVARERLRQPAQRGRLRVELRRRLRGRLSPGRRPVVPATALPPCRPAALLRPVEDVRLQVDLRVAAAEVEPADAVLQLEDVRGQTLGHPLAGHDRSAQVRGSLDGRPVLLELLVVGGPGGHIAARAVLRRGDAGVGVAGALAEPDRGLGDAVVPGVLAAAVVVAETGRADVGRRIDAGRGELLGGEPQERVRAADEVLQVPLLGMACRGRRGHRGEERIGGLLGGGRGCPPAVRRRLRCRRRHGRRPGRRRGPPGPRPCAGSPPAVRG
ncbi:hypothetical protein RB201_38925 [Streptomyces sp. S1A(2023)]